MKLLFLLINLNKKKIYNLYREWNLATKKKLRKVTKKMEIMRARTHHISMENFDDYFRNLKVLTKNKKIYVYYFIYEKDLKYYIQIRFKNSKSFTLVQLKGFTKEEPLKTNSEFQKVLLEYTLIDIFIRRPHQENRLHLARGSERGPSYFVLNELLEAYCIENNISIDEDYAGDADDAYEEE